MELDMKIFTLFSSYDLDIKTIEFVYPVLNSSRRKTPIYGNSGAIFIAMIQMFQIK